ncbi:hypothetical protein B0H10DRAFT_1974134 [Mycena sp. CBHHK59/15]|nr:hypothetical protein B0H10DRAFT_1974134 [Mycena sp. CBHHK59/15]
MACVPSIGRAEQRGEVSALDPTRTQVGCPYATIPQPDDPHVAPRGECAAQHSACRGALRLQSARMEAGEEENGSGRWPGVGGKETRRTFKSPSHSHRQTVPPRLYLCMPREPHRAHGLSNRVSYALFGDCSRQYCARQRVHVADLSQWPTGSWTGEAFKFQELSVGEVAVVHVGESTG